MDKISVVINTYNAERHLRKVLESALPFNEIVVCDMESTDATREIAAEFGCEIVLFPKADHTICEPARNAAIQAASSDWVLVVDADEVIPPAMPPFLYSHIKGRPDAPALDVCRLNRFMGRPASSGCDRQTRFFRKDAVYWPPTIHSRPEISGRIEKMPAARKDLYLIHLDDPTVRCRIDKLNNYSSREVDRRAGRKFGVGSLILRPAWSLFKSLFIRGGIKDGKRGLIRAKIESFYQLMVMAKVIEHQCETDAAQPEFPTDTLERVLHIGRNRVWIDYVESRMVAVKEFSPNVWRKLTRIATPDKATLSMRNATELIKRGFNTPPPVSVIIKRSYTGYIKQSFYISEYDSESIALADALKLYGDEVIRDFAGFVAELHTRGVIHKDLNNTNVRVRRSGGGKLSFSLIDLNRMKFLPEGVPVGRGEAFKNITRFCCLDETFHCFLRHYFAFRGIDMAYLRDAVNAKLAHDSAHARKSRLKNLFKK